MSAALQAKPTRGHIFAAVGTVIPAVLLFALFVLYVSYVPAAKKTFDEFGMTLPYVTQCTIRLSNWIAEYWWTTLPLVLTLGAGNFALLRFVGQKSRLLPILWITGVALLLLTVLALTLVSIALPMLKLKEGLAH